MTDRSKIKEALVGLFQDPEADTDLIIQNLLEWAKEDTDKIRFTVDAGIISRLGRELVARQETAVAELVKNAYDADASKVTLSFKDVKTPGGKLTITDNGNGMNFAQIVDGFLRIASTEKVRNPISPRFGRRVSGRKGIGRFAVQRLGKYLTLLTCAHGAENGFRVAFDWEIFHQDRDLLTISTKIETLPKSEIGIEHGTVLSIEDLRDRWTDGPKPR